MNYGQTDRAREIQIEVAAGSASTGGKRGESTIEERILSTDSGGLADGTKLKETLSACLLLDDVPIVLNVVGQLVFLNGPETCASQILSGFFLAPHRPQPFTTLRQ
jgi:hypothetical protein